MADGYGNRRVIVFDADTGAYKRHWGAYGNQPTTRWSCRVGRSTSSSSLREKVRRSSSTIQCTRSMSPTTAWSTLGTGVTCAFRSSTSTATFVREKFIRPGTLNSVGSVHGLAVSPDPDQAFLYVADGANGWVHVLDRETLEVVSRVGGRKGHNAREFFHLHSFASDSMGNFFVGEVNEGHRYYRWRFTGMGAAAEHGSAGLT